MRTTRATLQIGLLIVVTASGARALRGRAEAVETPRAAGLKAGGLASAALLAVRGPGKTGLAAGAAPTGEQGGNSGTDRSNKTAPNNAGPAPDQAGCQPKYA